MDELAKIKQLVAAQEVVVTDTRKPSWSLVNWMRGVMGNRKSVIVSKFVIAVVLSSVTAFNAYAHDSNRIEQLEREVQELEKRLSILESILQNETDEKELVVNSNGWKSVANWRKLSTGMSPSTVREILGEPKRIDGGSIAIWSYGNDGIVSFFEGKLDRWSEPR